MSAKKILVGCFVFSGLLAVWSLLIEPGLLTHRTIQVKWAGPQFKIVFISDLHAGTPHIKEKYILDLIKEINATQPDLILIGGDLGINHVLGGRAIPNQQIATWLGHLKARLGAYAVLGNHDWWNNTDEIRDALRVNGIQVIDNQSRMIQLESFKFWLVGIGDDFTRHSQPSLAFADAHDPMILLMHDPAPLLEINSRFLLALAGHMHGGQVALPWFGALVAAGRAPLEWANGLTELAHGLLFVTRGIGTSILPVRLYAPPEYVIVELAP